MSLTTYRFDCNGIHTYIHCPKHKAGRIHISYYFTFSYFRTRWMLESDWLTNVIVIIFRETLGERSSRHRITCPYYFAKWFELFQRSLQPKTAKEPKPHNDTGQTNKYSKQKDKKRQIISMFLPQNYVLLCTESTLSLSRSLSQTVCTHVNIHFRLLWRFYQ